MSLESKREITLKDGSERTLYQSKFVDKQDILQMLSQPHISSRNTSSQKVDDNGWYGTKSYQDAQNKYINGDDESYQLLKKVKVNTDKLFTNSQFKMRSIKKDVAGSTPNVVNALRGLPKSMFNFKLNPKNVIYKRVFMDRGFTWNISTDDIQLNGVLPLSLMEFLESTGKFRFEIWTGVSLDGDGDDALVMGTRVKEFSRPLNLYQLSFDLINPSFLRRIFCHLCEVNKNWVDITNTGYGSSALSDTDEYPDKFFDQLHDNTDTVILNSHLGLSTSSSDEDNLEIIKKAFGLIKGDNEDVND